MCFGNAPAHDLYMNITTFITPPGIVRKASKLGLTCKPWPPELEASYIERQMDNLSEHMVRLFPCAKSLAYSETFWHLLSGLGTSIQGPRGSKPTPRSYVCHRWIWQPDCVDVDVFSLCHRNHQRIHVPSYNGAWMPNWTDCLRWGWQEFQIKGSCIDTIVEGDCEYERERCGWYVYWLGYYRRPIWAARIQDRLQVRGLRLGRALGSWWGEIVREVTPGECVSLSGRL